MIITKHNYNLGRGIEKANEMFDRNSEFMRHYTQRKFEEFMPDMSRGTNFAEIMRTLCGYMNRQHVEVRLWRPWKLRWSSAIAMTKGKHIYMNRYKLDRTVESFVGSLFHEPVHITDGQDKPYYGHGNNYRYGKDFPMGKRRTAPYLIGEIAKIYAMTGILYDVETLIAWPRSWKDER